MKKITQLVSICAVFFLLLQSCESKKVVLNREVDTTHEGKMLLGYQTKNQLLKEPYRTWYTPEHDGYEVDQKTISELKKAKINSYAITVVLGTWCEDSHREVPRFFTVLESLNYADNKLTIIGVNRKKEAPSGEDGPLNIQRVPTFIISKHGKEIGRIVEYPKSGYLEKDLLEILNKNKTSFKDLLK